MLVVGLVKALRFDPKFFQQPLRHVAVTRWTLDRLRAPIADQRTIAGFELVALGVAAEVVVVVQNQDASLASCRLAIKIRGGKSADAASDNHQVVGLASFFRSAKLVPRFAVTQCMRKRVGSLVIAAHCGECRRVISGSLFRRILIGRHRGHPVRHRQHARADGDAVQKIAPGNRTAHPQSLIVSSIAHRSPLIFKPSNLPRTQPCCLDSVGNRRCGNRELSADGTDPRSGGRAT